MERTVKNLKTKVTAAKKGGSMAGLSVFDAEWALEKLEEYEETSIRTPVQTDDIAAVSHERDVARRHAATAVAALKKICDGGDAVRVAKTALQELGEI